MLQLSCVALVACGVSYLLVRVLISYAQRRLLDVPNARSSHTRPTPRGGGLGVALTVVAGTLGWAAWSGQFDRQLLAFCACAAAISALGWFDDLLSLRASIRFVIQGVVAAAFLAVTGVFASAALPLVGTFPLGLLAPAIAFVWIVGLTNAFNFMDGIDGIAGSQALVAGVAWACAGMLLGQPQIAQVGALIAGASLGFLAHNWPPARIFMGDVGSTFLGFVLAALPFLSRERTPTLPLFALLVTAPFVLDASFTFMRRLLRGEAVWQAHREHLYQRLVIGGWTHRRTTLLYAALALGTALLGLAFLIGTR
jgi:UDP-N-acetylmuramyl pentapeptide phosphotransferase/UDP-N-acetylglucosamine-1-phosphate transferase